MESEDSKPRSAGRVLLIWFSAGVALLLLGIALMAVLDHSQTTPVEQRLLGSWKLIEKSVSSTEPTRHLQFFSDGKFLSGNFEKRKELDLWRWRAADSKFEISNVSSDWVPDWINDLLGRSDWETYQIMFHDENTFELYQATPTGELIFEREMPEEN